MHARTLQKLIATVILSYALILSPTAVGAPILAIDLDLTTPGIQDGSGTTYAPGTTFSSAAIVAWDDGAPITPLLVDSVIMTLVSSGTAATFSGPTSAGAFAGAMSLVFDAGSPVAVAPGSPLTPIAPAGPLTTGLVGYFALGAALLPLDFGATLATATAFTDLLKLPTITLGTSGSAILSILGAPTGSEIGFTAGPGPLFPSLFGATVTVSSTTPPPPTGVPLPATLWLILLGGAALIGRRR